MGIDYRNPHLRKRMVNDVVKAMKLDTPTSPEQQLAMKAQQAIDETAQTLLPIVAAKGFVEQDDELKLGAIALQCLVDKLRSWDKEELITCLCARMAMECVERVR